MPVTQEYIAGLAPIYCDILSAFPRLEPGRKEGYGLAYQTLSAELRDQYSFDEIKTACEKMAAADVVVIRLGIFVCPTPLGEEIIAEIVGRKAPAQHVPDFVPPT